jgi:hypothetical protein
MLSTPGPKNPLVRRVEIAQAAVDTFLDKPFDWGANDCARLAAFVLRHAGYKPNLGQFGTYRTDLAARRALKARKMKTVIDWIDSVSGLVRITPAAALPCDLIAFPGVGGWEGLTVALGNGRVLGFTETAENGACSVIDVQHMELAVAAWSVQPCRKS